MIMEENIKLPKEVVEQIKTNAALRCDRNEGRDDSSFMNGYYSGYITGATAYATKLHQANETIKVLTDDNNRLKGEVEGLKNWKMNAAEELTIVGAYAHKHLEVNPSDSIAQLVMAHLNEGRTLLNEVFSKHEAGLDRLIYEKIKTFLYGE